MHELGLTQEIVAVASERARGAKVRRVVLEIGKLSAVLPDAVRFCFDLCAEDTALEGATLEIVETPGRARCRACAAELELDRPFGRCVCGNSDLEWLAGDELRIRALEIA
jgi:hydrogenase nickel incorporation protein HypA/HybF